MTGYSDIINFWFSEPMCKHWFSSTPELDRKIKERFESIWEQAAAGKLDDWRASAEGCLALAIVLDQLPLNMFRGEAKSFSTEAQSRSITKHALDRGFERQLSKEQLAFLYMPFMHSESIADQELSVALFTAAGLEENARFAEHHREIIRRFGRFPHRNAILKRESSKEEREYLDSDKAFTG